MKTYLFPGQGSQKKGMGGTLFDAFPALTAKADALLGYSIKALCLQDIDNQLNQTQYTQPALYVVNALSYQQKIKEAGTTPDFVAGHSLGEYNALQAAGAVSFEDGLKLVKKRGELMSQAAEGAMAAVVNMKEDAIEQCLQDNDLSGIDIANYNAPTQIVISGLREDITRAQACFQEAGALLIPLKTSGAFHSRYMKPAGDEFRKHLTSFHFSELQIPVMSNVHAEPYSQDAIAVNLADQITCSVKWSQSIEYLLHQGEMTFEELGVGDVLTQLLKKIKRDFLPRPSASQTIANTKPNGISKPAPQQSTQTDNPPSDDPTTRIRAWNSSYSIGTKVMVNGYDKPLETRTEAMVLFGHRAAIYMEGYNGYFALDDVTPVGELA